MAMTTLGGLSHIVMTVSDVDQAISFYSEVFGWTPLFDSLMEGSEFDAVVAVANARCRSVGGMIGDIRLEFVNKNWVNCAPGPAAAGVSCLSFYVEDAQKAWEYCQEKGVIASGPPHTIAGCSIFFIEGPDKQRLEIVQFLPGTDAWGGKYPRMLPATGQKAHLETVG